MPLLSKGHAGARLLRHQRRHSVALHALDTLHTLLERPTGSGKSVALGYIVSNFRAIPGGQVFFMGEGYSAFRSHQGAGRRAPLISEKRKYRFNHWRGSTVRPTG